MSQSTGFHVLWEQRTTNNGDWKQQRASFTLKKSASDYAKFVKLMLNTRAVELVATIPFIEEEDDELAPTPKPIKILSDGRCDCSYADKCPLGKCGSALRCTKEELQAAGIVTMFTPADDKPICPACKTDDAMVFHIKEQKWFCHHTHSL
jgi:hypothetical protein